MSEMLSTDFRENVEKINNLLNVNENFDIIYRTMKIGGREACFYFIDGFAKDEVMEKLMEFFYKTQPEEMPKTTHEWTKEKLPYGETDLIRDFDTFIKKMLSGVPCLLIEGYMEILAIDFRTYPGRSVDEPEKDKVMRGSRDGFVETLVFNTALIRRRIRNPKLTMEILSVGDSSKTDIVISYMKDRANLQFLEEIKKRINEIKIDALTMNQESLVECLYKRSWINPFPKFKYTERPDATAAAILEGNIVIMVDNSPSAIILPSSIFDIIEEADDFYFPPVTGTYLRISRFIINLAAWLLIPTFLLLMQYPQWIPGRFAFIEVTEPINIPLVIQFLILEFAIDGLRLASLNTPSMLSTPLSVVAGIVLGDFTVSSGWFNSESMLYMAFVAIANYSQASFELGYAIKFMRIICIITTGLFGIYGYIGGIILTIAAIVTNKTISGKSYIYPLIPFNGTQLMRRFFRVSLPKSEQGK